MKFLSFLLLFLKIFARIEIVWGFVVTKIATSWLLVLSKVLTNLKFTAFY
jgi:hypothetical protein